MDNQMSLFPKQPKMVKTGYVRMVSAGKDTYVSFKELAGYSKDALTNLRIQLECGDKKMYCACCQYDDLELQVTANNVIRVKYNGQQDRHMESCPKSVRYGAWLSENTVGTDYVAETDSVLFKITLPGTGSASSSSSSAGSGSGKSDRISLLDMVKSINAIAWERQTYSRKKEISLARKERRASKWNYKNLREFSQLIYGISHEIYVQFGANIVPFNTLFYQVNTFWNCTDFKQRFFIYTEVAKFSPYRAEWKYQYLTVWLPSQNGKKQTTLRVRTDIYNKMLESVEESSSCKMMLAGYINHSIFPDENGQTREYANLLKGVLFYVSAKGLYAETEYVAHQIDELCATNLIFKRPYFPLENYYNHVPTMIVESLKGKDVLIDVVSSTERKYKEHCRWAENNSEYKCIVLHDGENVGNIAALVEAKLREK